MNLKLENTKNELEDAINNSSDIEKIFEISSKIDKKIEKIYKQDYTKRKFDEILDADEAKETIINIKSDLTNKFYNISPLDVEIISQNIYDYCCLMVNGFSRQEIISYIKDKNLKYCEQLSEEEKNCMTINHNINFYYIEGSVFMTNYDVDLNQSIDKLRIHTEVKEVLKSKKYVAYMNL